MSEPKIQDAHGFAALADQAREKWRNGLEAECPCCERVKLGFKLPEKPSELVADDAKVTEQWVMRYDFEGSKRDQGPFPSAQGAMALWNEMARHSPEALPRVVKQTVKTTEEIICYVSREM